MACTRSVLLPQVECSTLFSMLENNQEKPANVQPEAQPFDPNDTERIAELNAKFESPDAFTRVKSAKSLDEMISILGTATRYDWSEGGSNRTVDAKELKVLLEEVSQLVKSGADEATILAVEDKIPDMGLLSKVRSVRSHKRWVEQAGDDPWANL